MAQWIRVINELPVVEVKPVGNKEFSDTELVMLIGTNEPARMFPGDDGQTMLLFDGESSDPVNERACALLEIPTAKNLRERIIDNGKQPDEELLARSDEERAWEIRGNVLLHSFSHEKGERLNNLPAWTPEAVRTLIASHDSQNTPRQGELLTLGYAEDNAEQRIDEFLSQSASGLLVDIRYHPRSRWYPAFNQRALLARYGPQYEHCRALGNVNYNQPEESIKLFEPEQGIEHVLKLLQSGHSVLLLCVCKYFERCHRKVAYDLICATLAQLDVPRDAIL